MGLLTTWKKIVLVILVLLLVAVSVLYIYKRIFAKQNSATEQTAETDESAIRITKGSDYIEEPTPTPFVKNTTSADSDITEDAPYTGDPSTIELNDDDGNRAVMSDMELIENLESKLKKATKSDLWFYGTLNIVTGGSDEVVVIEYNNVTVTPKSILLYNPKDDAILEPTYMNDEQDGVIYWEMSVLADGTYGVLVELNEPNESIGEYSIYNMNKEDFDNMNEFTGILAPDDEE